MDKKDYSFIEEKVEEFLKEGDMSIEKIKSTLSKFRSQYDGINFITILLKEGGPSVYSNQEIMQYLLKTNLSLSAKAEELGGKDGLTKLLNRQKLIEGLKSNLARAKRYNERLSLFLLDLDDFKIINDKYGHQIGDSVLIKSAEYIKENSRNEDIVGRYGGEEFLIGLPNISKEGASYFANRIRDGINSLKLKGFDQEITLTGGISTYPDDGGDLDSLILMADSALYHGKKEGKNRIVPYEEGIPLIRPN